MNLWLRLLRIRATWRRRSTVEIWGEARTPFRVAVTDLDPYRHMNNGRYLTLLDLGRLDLMLRSGIAAELGRRGWYPVVAGQTITYRRSLTLGQRFEIRTRIVGLDERWIYLQQDVVSGDVVHASAVIRARFLKRTGGSVSHDELAAVVGEPPGRLEVPAWMTEWSSATRIPTDR